MSNFTLTFIATTIHQVESETVYKKPNTHINNNEKKAKRGKSDAIDWLLSVNITP